MSNFKITIDGRQVEAEPGMTVLQAARAAGLYIPSLCAHKDLSPYGACRLCVVEIDGLRGTPTACTTPVADGMNVRTSTPGLELQRRHTLELMLSSHPSPCLTCDSREDCESVKKTPAHAGASTRCSLCSNRPTCAVRSISIGTYTRDIGLPVTYSADKIEKSDPFIDRDHNLCVLCAICARVCEKLHDKPAISITKRGKDAKIAAAFGKDWILEECTFCGACVDECPTGSLTDRWSKWYGVPDKEVESYCQFCPKRCKISLKIKNGKLISTGMVSLDKETTLCAIGRFAYPQVFNSRYRLTRPYVKMGTEMTPATWQETIDSTADILSSAKKLLVIAGENLSDETRSGICDLVKGLKAEFVEMPYGSTAKDLPKSTAEKISEFDAVFCLGNYLAPDTAKNAKKLIIVDFAKNSVHKSADVLIPAAILAETGGTFEDENGVKICISPAVKPSGMQRPVAGVLADLLMKLNLPHESGFKAPKIELGGDPKKDKKALPRVIYGNIIADFVPDLRDFGQEQSGEYAPKKSDLMGEPYEILENKLLAPNFHMLKIKAPDMAKYAKPGQFAILMADSHSERSPFTIADWNADEGWVKFVIEEVGRSSSELGSKKAGESLATVSGPLGTPLDFSQFESANSILLLGGCYGIAAIYPLAREFKRMGKRVVAAIEASSAYLLYNKEQLMEVADALIIKTRDGTEGTRGGVSDVYAQIGANFDAAIAIGCVFMMKQNSRVAKEIGKKSLCALNPIMVDGTGMCGACRVSVGGETKFACVHGPFFDLDKVDFDELAKRRSAYSVLEVDAMPRHEEKCHHHK